MGQRPIPRPYTPAGMSSESVVAEADLMTLLRGREVCFSRDSPDSSRWRARRAARSLMALGVELSTPSAEGPRGDDRSHTSLEPPAVTGRWSQQGSTVPTYRV